MSIEKDLKLQKMYSLIKTQRQNLYADVDKYGLASISRDFPQENYRFFVLVHLILSSQTRDLLTHETLCNLIKLNISDCFALNKLSVDEIQQIIYKVGFSKTKANYLKIFSENYENRDMPINYDELIKIKGVGNKMAYLYLQYATKEVIGIGVDVHVLRVCNRLGMNAKTADDCDKILQSVFDKEEWDRINQVLVGFGQLICNSKKPKCKECSVRELCPSSTFNYYKGW